MSTLKANSYQHVDRASPSIIINSDGSVSISSTVTYEDVTSVDAVGVITGRSNADLQNRVNVGSGVSIKAGGLNVTAGISTFGQDVHFTGSSQVALHWDQSTDDLIFDDNAQAKFGDSGDLSIYHSSSDNNSYIVEGGSGSLMIQGDVVNIGNVGSTKYYIRAYEDGKVELRHAQSTKLQTTTSGISVSDELNVVGLTTIGGDVSIADKIIHTGDTNTAIRFPAADTVTIETAGSERLRVTATGQALIGIDNAVASDVTLQLHSASSGVGPILNLTNDTGDCRIFFGQDNSSGSANSKGQFRYNVASDYLAAHTNGDERLRIQSNGRVGVGTESARAFLDLCGAAENATLLLDSNDENSNLCLMDNTGSVRMLNYGGALALRVGGTGAFSGDTEKVRIDSAGRVLINTTSNTNAHTQCDDLVVGNTSHGHDTGVTIVSNPSYSGWLAFSDGTSASDQRKGAIVYAQSKDTMYFRNSGNTTRLSINQDGNAEFTGIVTATEFVPTVTQTGGFKNLIINGDMACAQYATSDTSDAQGRTTVDRWSIVWNGAEEVISRYQESLSSSDTGPWEKGFRKAWKIQNGNQTGGADANGYVNPQYGVEAQDLANSGWDYTSSSSYITYSFWAKSSVAQTFYAYLRTMDGTGQAYSFSYALPANTWTKVIKKIPGNSNITINNDNGGGLLIYHSLFLGTDRTNSGNVEETWAAYSSSNRTKDSTTTWYTTNDSTYHLTGVQLEVGSEATPFEHISYNQQLARCQRYYYLCASGATAGAANRAPICTTCNYNASYSFGVVYFGVPMRTTPTISSTEGTNYYRIFSDGGSDTFDNVSLQSSSPEAYCIQFYGNLSRTAGSGSWAETENAATRVAFSAEF